MLEIVFRIVFEGATYALGHSLLWCITFGRWQFYGKHDNLALFVGCLFWFMIFAGIWFLFPSTHS
jgi:hypothetical protein